LYFRRISVRLRTSFAERVASPASWHEKVAGNRHKMNQYAVVAVYCLFCLAACALVMRFLKTSWAYFVAAATLPALITMGAGALWRGFVDAWADIAFVMAWLIAFGCALVCYIVTLLIADDGGPNNESKESAAP
jgi:hypothetical protein